MRSDEIHLRYSVIPPTHTLRVASLNLLNNPANLTARVVKLSGQVRELDIDVLLLQEVRYDQKLLPNGDSTWDYLVKNTDLEHVVLGGGVGPKSEGNVILSRHPLLTQKAIGYDDLPDRGALLKPMAYAELLINDRHVHIFNVHLAWGSPMEPVRVAQAEKLVTLADEIWHADPTAITLCGGDFNAEETSGTLRFLYGEQPSFTNMGTLWVDAWRMFGDESNRITSDPETYWGAQTGASLAGLHNLDLVPKRRIDYLLTHNWSYGKQGSPLSFGRFADTDATSAAAISDHFGIMTDIYVPPVG